MINIAEVKKWKISVVISLHPIIPSATNAATFPENHATSPHTDDTSIVESVLPDCHYLGVANQSHVDRCSLQFPVNSMKNWES